MQAVPRSVEEYLKSWGLAHHHIVFLNSQSVDKLPTRGREPLTGSKRHVYEALDALTGFDAEQ